MTPSGSTRQQWMDVLRGAAIVLVVAWHAPAIPRLLGYDIPGWLMVANNALLPFRMPMLMFLSGMLLDHSLSKGTLRYYRGKLRALVWPYLLWSAVHLLTFEHRPAEALAHPMRWFAVGYLWFLFFIMVYYLAAPLLVRLPEWLVPVAAAVASWVIDSPQLSQMAYFAVFFFTGRIAARHRARIDALLADRRIVAGILVVAVAYGCASAMYPEALTYRAGLAPFALACVFAGIVVARWALRRWRLGGLQSIGRTSIVYYVSHFPVIHGVTLAARGLGIHHVVVVAIVGFVAALGVGRLLASLKRTAPVSWLFTAPQLTAAR